MFVLRSTFNALQEKYKRLERSDILAKIEAFAAHKENHQLMKELKKLQDDVDYYKTTRGSSFTDAEIKSLIQLCHPDKHSGKQSAVDMTVKLLKMRK